MEAFLRRLRKQWTRLLAVADEQIFEERIRIKCCQRVCGGMRRPLVYAASTCLKDVCEGMLVIGSTKLSIQCAV